LAGPTGIEPLKPTVLKIPSDFEAILKDYREFCLVNRGMRRRVAKDYYRMARRYLKFCKGVVSEETVRAFLSQFLRLKPKTYNNMLYGLRSFVGHYLNRMDIMERFKRVWQPMSYERVLPTKQQLKRAFESLTCDLERALFLFYATTGLRRSEVLKLREENIDRKLRCVKPNHDTRTKKSGVTFYNEECKRYLDRLHFKNGKVFRIGGKRFKKLWNKASAGAGMRITAQVLRVWHSTTLGELGVPDRYVDVFQGRAPKSMIARFYTGKELLRLKRIYDKANLKVLNV
jgi:integrase